MVHLLKKELIKTQNESITNNDDTSKYRQYLVATLHKICMKYPDVLISDQLISVLFDLFTYDDEPTATLVFIFTREYILKNPQHKNLLVSKVLEIFLSVKNSKIHRPLIWLLGEYCEESDPALINDAMTTIRNSLGEIPIVESEVKKLENGDENVDPNSGAAGSLTTKLVTADGSYATQSALSISSKSGDKTKIPPLRSYLLSGDFFVATALANTFVKFALKFKESHQSSGSSSHRTINSFVAECMLVLTSILHLGKARASGVLQVPETSETSVMSEDDFERIALCLVVLSQLANDTVSPTMKQIFIGDMRGCLELMLNSVKKDDEKDKKVETKCIEIDDHLNFSQLLGRGQDMLENQFELSLSRAIGGNVGPTATSSTSGKSSSIVNLLSASKLSKVTQLTGFSDPIYAECYVNVNQYDIVLDVLIVNQTNDVLQNCALELSTLGDLKLVERPQPIVLAAHDFANVKATVKVASTENGIIFGNIGRF